MVFNSLILPYFTYSNLIWSNAFESRLIWSNAFESRPNKLVVLHEKAIRIIGKAEFLADADLYLKNLDC